MKSELFSVFSYFANRRQWHKMVNSFVFFLRSHDIVWQWQLNIVYDIENLELSKQNTQQNELNFIFYYSCS